MDMEQTPRVSVAMATYNGEKFIEEQLLSICRQTRKVDEIVISDDGSRDSTLEIVDRVSKCEDAWGIDFVVITDNPRHGYCGNFEWAIQHTTGDLIFLSDQDDVWMPEKVAEMIDVFERYPDAECVCHNATLIDKEGASIEGVFEELFSKGKLNVECGTVIKIDRETYLEESISWGAIRGMSMCISRKCANNILPFPRMNAHDKWITVCAILDDSMYYVNCVLTLYRLHGNNTCGSSVYTGTVIDKIKRRILRSFINNQGCCVNYYQMGMAIKTRLEERGYENHAAHKLASRLVEIGEKIYNAETSGRFMGAIRLCELFCTDMRYRRSGTGAFLQELIYIIRHSKKERLQNVSEGVY